jgi:hypothetical protein
MPIYNKRKFTQGIGDQKYTQLLESLVLLANPIVGNPVPGVELSKNPACSGIFL